MTKVFDIISLSGHLYMVDKEAVTGSYYYFVDALGNKSIRRHQEIKDSRNSKCVILASDDKHLLELPLLPKVEKDILDIAKRVAILRYGSIKEVTIEETKRKMFGRIEYYNGYIDGYKAASVKKEIISVEVEIENNELKLNDNQVIVKSWIFRTFV